MIEETKRGSKAVFKSQREDKLFVRRLLKNGKPDLWKHSQALVFSTYYEYSNDQRVIDLMTDYFKGS